MNKIVTTINDITMLIKSDNNPTAKEYFVLFIFMLEKYRVKIYMVVSVLPCITEASLPIKLSGPYVLNILFNTTKLLEPDIGLKRARLMTSVGKFIALNNGRNKFVKSFIILLLVRRDIAINIAKIVGNKFITIVRPSFTPSKKISKISIFLYNPYINIIIVIIGAK